jgi:hypothetical protein
MGCRRGVARMVASPISRWQSMANTEHNASRIRSERNEGSNPGEVV